MKNMSFVKAGVMSLAVSLAGVSALAPTAANAELSGNIGVHSKYLLRGIFEENDGTAVQGGLDYAHDSGAYLGLWFSNLGYKYDSSTGVAAGTGGFENDIYGGFAGELGNGIGWDLGFIQYLYVDVDDSDLLEITGSLSYGDGYVGFQYLTNDGWWGNAGDVYWKAGYSFALPEDFSLALDLGYYTYDDDDNKELGGCAVPACVVTTEDDSFRHFNITLSRPVGTTGAEWYLQYTIAGEDRTGFEYDDTMVAGVTYGFDI